MFHGCYDVVDANSDSTKFCVGCRRLTQPSLFTRAWDRPWQDYVVDANSNLISAFMIFVLTVQGNAGPAIDSAVRMDLVNLRTFHMEYDICSVSCYIIDPLFVTVLCCFFV
jgi:hypothetical protein